MTLKRYREKRHFDETPEPAGRVQKAGGQLHFVVQKHHARRLHYDFRLELDGVLKSWAIPKGPSLDPADKRLAIMVEDHPMDYRTFEGIIPEGNYGAGTVMVWDEGTYHAIGASSRAESERMLAEGLEKGSLKFVLEGQKLKGEFALVKLRKGEKQWLLIKHRDAQARDDDIRDAERSAQSGRTLAEIAAARDRTWQSNRPASSADKTELAQRIAASISTVNSQPVDLDDAPKGKMPHHVRPMLATSVTEPFDRDGWFFEVKFDGFRAIAEVEDQKVRLYSRNQLSYLDRFPAVAAALEHLGHDAVLDGEIVAMDEQGRPRFELLQNYAKEGKGQLAYHVFDILYLDGHDLRGLPLRRRKQILQQIVPHGSIIRFTEHIENQGIVFLRAVVEHGLEGVIAKNASSRYVEGRRSPAWLKLKVRQRQEAVIGGFTAPRGSRERFGALVLGVYEGRDLVYIGHTGGGFDSRTLEDVYARLEPLVQKECPFRQKPATNEPARWVAPQLVCEVMFQEWSRDGRMRFPIFVGLRDDKPPEAVHREEAKETTSVLAKENEEAPAKPQPATVKPEPKLTNLTKVYWPDDGTTKGDLIDYYRAVADILVPHLVDRPQSLHRHPNGIDKPSFFQKNVGNQPPPDWVKTTPIISENDGDAHTYLLCQDQPSLLYMANLGCIEINPWMSRLGSLDRPDFVVIDLDPEDVPFDRVVETAQAVHKLLEQIGADSVCKTSGKRGLHVYVPLRARYEYELAKQFAELIARLVHGRLPETTSLARMPAHRQKRVYLDHLQNGRGKTLAAPYSVRPVPGALVSTPLTWREVKRGLDPHKFTIRTVPKRLKRVGDLFQPVLSGGADLEKCLARLASLTTPPSR
jgi:bifunctional non-homologous end joining protein LigD